MDRRESIKSIVGALAVAAAGTGITVRAAHPTPEKVQESLVERAKRRLKPLESLGKSVSVYKDVNPLEQLNLFWTETLYTKHEACQSGSQASVETLAKWRVDTLTWRVLDHFGLGDGHGPA